MEDFSPAGFGRAVQTKREALDIPQELFGQRVGYKAGAGAGVSISRIETGRMLPPATRRIAIAEELGLTVDALEALATEKTRELEKTLTSTTSPVPRKQSVREQAAALNDRVQRRKEQVDSLGFDMAQAYQESSEKFYLPFMEFSKSIKGIPAPSLPTDTELRAITDPTTLTPETFAKIEVKTHQNEIGEIIAGVILGGSAGGALGALAAFGTYQGFALFGAASTGVANSYLHGIAQRNAILAGIGGGPLAMGGGGVKAGVSRLAATVALPLIAGAITGGILADQRRRKEVAKISAELDAAVREMDAVEPGLKKLQAVIPQATETLNYVSLHATHSFERWRKSFGEPPHTWEAMSSTQKEHFEELLEVAACQLALVGLETGQLLNFKDEQLESLSSAVKAVVQYTDDRIRTLI